MDIKLRKITVEELVKDYKDDGEFGVKGYNGKLDIRPSYQREFIYKDKQRDAVIDTIEKNFMYWSVRNDGTYEIIDGQQRTISIAQYITGVFSIDGKYFHNLPDDKQKQMNNYDLTIYVCEGTESERLDWFRVINIAGTKLTEQELRNAVYSGSWISDAKKYFSKKNCVAYNLAKAYLNGSPIRQEYLETVIKWISNNNIEEYMGQHQHDLNAKFLWDYFQQVVDWIKKTFTEERKQMKGLDWGRFYNSYKNKELDPIKVENEIKELIFDEEIQNQKGIYEYILSRDKKHLNLRKFPEQIKQRVFEKQKGICKHCNNEFKISKMEADHITPWTKGGKTIEENCQLLCKNCNRQKSNN